MGRRSGARGKPLSFECLIPAGENVSGQIAQIFERELSRLGVRMRIRALDWPSFSARVAAGEFDARLAETVFVPPNLDPYPAFHSSQAPPLGFKVGHYADQESDRLMEAGRREPDPAVRLSIYRAIHRRLALTQPAAFLFTVDSLWAVDRRLEGVATSPLGLSHSLPGRRAWRWRASP